MPARALPRLHVELVSVSVLQSSHEHDIQMHHGVYTEDDRVAYCRRLTSNVYWHGTMAVRSSAALRIT